MEKILTYCKRNRNCSAEICAPQGEGRKSPYELDHDFVKRKLEAGICEATGLPLIRTAPDGVKINPFTPSLDRIIPSLGYIPSNVRLVCFAFNRAKSDWGDEVLLQIATALVHRNRSP